MTYITHMAEDKTLFSSFTPRKWGFILYGDYNKWSIIGSSTLSKYPQSKN